MYVLGLRYFKYGFCFEYVHVHVYTNELKTINVYQTEFFGHLNIFLLGHLNFTADLLGVLYYDHVFLCHCHTNAKTLQNDAILIL